MRNHFLIEPCVTKILRVDEIEIEDFGIIKKANIKFSLSLNIIIGKNMSGKSIVIKYLMQRFGDPDIMSYSNIALFQLSDVLNDTTILIDDLLNKFDDEKLVRTLSKLASCGRQVIVTLNIFRWNKIKDKVKAKVNIINTEDFELKTYEDEKTRKD